MHCEPCSPLACTALLIEPGYPFVPLYVLSFPLSILLGNEKAPKNLSGTDMPTMAHPCSSLLTVVQPSDGFSSALLRPTHLLLPHQQSADVKGVVSITITCVLMWHVCCIIIRIVPLGSISCPAVSRGPRCQPGRSICVRSHVSPVLSALTHTVPSVESPLWLIILFPTLTYPYGCDNYMNESVQNEQDDLKGHIKHGQPWSNPAPCPHSLSSLLAAACRPIKYMHSSACCA